MAKALPLPDGTTVAIREGETPAQTWARAQQMYPDAFGLEEEKKPKQDTTGLKAAASSGFTRLGGEMELLKGKLGVKSEAEAQKDYEAAQAKAAARFTPTEKSWTEDPFLKFKETLGGSIPYMVAPAVAGGVGALAATGVGAPAAVGLAGLLGAGAASTGQFTASNLAAQMGTGKSLEDASLGKAVGAAIPQALMDTAAMALLPGIGKLFGSVGSKLTTAEARAIAEQTLGRAAADYTAKTGMAMGREGLTETAQQVLERLQAGLSITDPEARKEYVDSFIGGAALAGVGAPIGRYTERSAAKGQAEKADSEDKKALAKQNAQAQQEEQAKQEAERNKPEYALSIADQLQKLEQEKLDLKSQVRKISKDSTTEAEDKAHNKEINAQLQANSRARDVLAPEKVRLVKSGLYEQALEERRVAALTPEEYALEQTKTVSNKAPKVAESDLGGYYEQQVLVPGEERRKAEAAQIEARAVAPAKYAAERMELARTQMPDPSGQDYLEYLLQNPFMAQQIVETKTPLPGLSNQESSLLRNDLKKMLSTMSKEELASRQADLQAQKPGKIPANPMATYMEQNQGLDVDRQEGQTEADIAKVEQQAKMPRDIIQQGELFGTPERVNTLQAGVKLETIPEKLATLQKQLDVARAARNAEKTGGRGRMSETVSNIIEQMRLLKEQQAKGEGRAGTEFGTETAELPAYIGAGEQGQTSALPEQLKRQQEAQQARIEALDRLRKVKGTVDEDAARQEVITGMIAEIEAARGKLKPETITAIEQDVNQILNPGVRYNYDVTPQLDILSNRWRAGTRAGQTVTASSVPINTSKDMLQEQMDRAFAQRDRYDTQTLSILDQVADNFGAVTANNDRLNMVGEWLNRVTTTGKSSPEMTRDVQDELARLEEGKRSETETPTRETAFGTATKPTQQAQQLELPERFMPKAVEGQTPTKASTAFTTAAEFQKYLASDALKLVRQALGMGKDTASRMHNRLQVFTKKIDNISKHLASLETRKKALQDKRGADANLAKDLLNTAETNLKNLYERLDAELAELQIEYLQARRQFEFTAQTVADIGQKVADNTEQFKSTETAVVEAAQKTSEAKTAYAAAIEQPVNKRTFSALRKARRTIITAIEKQITTSRKANADETFLTFLNADLNLQLQLLEEERVMDQDAQALLNAGLALEEAAATQKRSRKNQKEITQAQKELAAALELKGSVAKEMVDTDAQIAQVEQDINKADEQLAIAQQKLEGRQAQAGATFAQQLESIKIDPLSSTERAAKQAEDKATLDEFQASTNRLAALSGQRIDFSKRQEMLALLRVSVSDSDRLEANIKDIESGIEEMQIQVAIAEEMLVDEKAPEKVAALNKKVQDGNNRIALLKQGLGQTEKAKDRKVAEENKARRLLSGDVEVTADLDKRIDKLVANIKNQEVLANQTTNPKTGKDVPAETVKDRAKTLARYKRELTVLTGVRSNRLGIKRIDVTTNKQVSIKNDRLQNMQAQLTQLQEAKQPRGAAKQAERAEQIRALQEQINKQTTPRASRETQEQFDVAFERTQQRGVENDRLQNMQAQLEKLQNAKQPRGAAKQAERAEQIRALQEQVNKQIAIVDALTPKQVGKGSPATRVQSAAPGKLRGGTEESKANAGISRQPIVEQRTTTVPTAKQAIEDANALAERIVAAKKPDELLAELQSESATQKFNVLQGIKTLIADFRRNISRAETELQPLLDAAEEDKADLGARTFIKEMREKTQPSQTEKGLVTFNGVDLDVQENGDNDIYVSLIRTNDPKDLRTGKATRALIFLKRLADKHNVTLTLRPEPVGESTMTAKELEQWYEREGFTSGDAGMYRKPETSGKRIAELRNIIGKNNSLLYRAESSLVQAEAEAYPSLKEQTPTGENVSTVGGWNMGVQGNEDIVLRTVTTKGGATLKTQQVESLAKRITEGWANAPVIEVVANEEALPVRLRGYLVKSKTSGKVPGMYDTQTKKVYLIASALHDANDVLVTIAHEAAGHHGLREMLGGTYTKVMDDIFAGNKEVRELAKAKMGKATELSQQTAVEEVLAELAEKPNLTPAEKNALQRIIAAIKQWAAKTFGFKNMTDEEVRQIVANARQYVIEGREAAEGQAPTGAPALRTKTAQPTNALEQLAQDVIAQPKTWREKMGNHVALQAEMQAVDMRAGLQAALKTGAKELGDENLYTQAMYNVRKADQKMPLIDTVMRLGPLELYKDEKGLYGVRSTNKNSAKDVLEAIAALPYKTAAEKDNIATIYMIAQRAANKGLNKLDLGALGVTEEKLQDAMAVVDADPALKDALENVRRVYNEYNKGMINFLVDTRRISKDFAKELLKDGDYVPYYRVQENGLATLNFGNNKMVTVGDIRRQPYLAKLKGGETKILPISESLPRNTLLLTDMALTNMATRSVAYGLQAIGKGRGEIDPNTGKPKNLMSITPGKGGADGRVIRFYEEPDPNKPGDTGERFVQVDTGGTSIEGIPAELVVQSLEGAHLALPEILKLAGAAGDLLRTGVTRTPLYIARQLFKDPMAAAFTGGLNYNAFTAVLKAGKEFVKMTRGTSENEAKLLEKGLIQSGIFAGDVSDMKKMALQIASGKDMGIIDKIFAALDRAAMRADATTRALVMENAMKNGLSEVEADMATMESMNFYKRGLSPTVQYANRLIPFLNAQIQGLNVLYKAATGKMPFEEQQKIKRKFLNNAALLTATGIVYAMAMEDDEYFRNAKPKDKYSNFFLHLPGVDEPLKLPIPYEAGYFFSLAVAAVDGMREETDGAAQWRALKDMFLNTIPGYSSMGVPQLVKPAFEVWTNKNFLTGAPVESLRLQGLDPEERYTTTTTEVAKGLAKAVPILSPIQIEHLVRGYLGVLPLAAAAGANSLFASETKGERPEGRTSDLPLIGTQFQKKFGGADNEVVFHLADEAKQARSTFNNMLKEGRREDAVAYRDSHRVALSSASAAGQYQQLVGRINLDVRRTQERNDLSGAEKRDRLDKLDEAKQAAAQRFIQLVKRLESAAS